MTESREVGLGIGRRGALTALAVLLTVSACSGPVQVRRVPSVPPFPKVASGPGSIAKGVPRAEEMPTEAVSIPLDQLSAASRQTLRLMHLEEVAGRSPKAVMRASQVLHQRTGEGRFAAVAAELAFRVAQELRADPRRAAEWYLTAAARAWDFLVPEEPAEMLQRAFDPRFQASQEIYQRSVAAYLALLPGVHGGYRDHRQPGAWEIFEVTQEVGLGLRSGELYDRLVPVDGLQVQGLRNHYQRPGLGTPLVAVRENLQRMPMDRFYPPEGIVRPLTAVLVFEPNGGGELQPHPRRRVALRLYDPFRVTHVEAGERRLPLAADFTTPWAYLAEQAELTAGLIRAEKAWDHLGLFMIEPYDPEKIPVIMIHGLRSTPLAWLELTNDVMGNPLLRRHYQVWHFTYPTSLPYLYTGHLLRSILEELQVTVDPEDYHPALDDVVIVGHSMGGLVAKTLVTDPGDRLWNAMMRVSPEELTGPAEDVERLRSILRYRPVPAVRRVIFIATPHDGSGMAASFLGKLSSALVRLPEEFRGFFERLVVDNPGAVNPQVEKVLQKPTSIRGLDPGHPMLQTLATLRIVEGVEYHSIIGDRGGPGAVPTGDGVVPYSSSSLPGAASERVVPNAAHDVYTEPAAIAEIQRILRLHLQQRDGGMPERDRRRPVAQR